MAGSSEGGRETKRARQEDADDVYDPWRHRCQDCFTFHLLESVTEAGLNNEIAAGGQEFEAEFFHQHFGEDEVVKGYKELRVHVWLSASTYHVWVDIKHKQKKLGADQIVKVFSENFPEGVARSQQDFVSSVVSTAPQLAAVDWSSSVYGQVEAAGKTAINIHRFKLAAAPQAVQSLHARFEPLLLFFIDGASLIEKDEKWEALLALQKPPHGNAAPPRLLGLCTCYHFWAYQRGGSGTHGRGQLPTPDLVAEQQEAGLNSTASRIRLSQILVMPTYRDLGVGKALLGCAYEIARTTPGCVDLTIEDPTPNLQRVREKYEAERILAAPWVMQQAQACVAAVKSGGTQWPAQHQTEDSVRTSQHTSEGGVSTTLNAHAGSQGGSTGSSTVPSLAAASLASLSAHGSNNGACGSGGGGGLQDTAAACLYPPGSFLHRITQEFKIYSKEARLVWEAVLFMQSGLWEAPRGREALMKLVRVRLEAANFAHCGADAQRKALVVMSKAKPDQSFIMMRARPSEGPVEAGESSSGVAQGRLSVSTISAEEKEQQLSEMCDERLEQLRALKSLVSKRK